MSANIPETMLVSDLLKSTGYNCPDNLKDSTFDEATSGGGGDVRVQSNKTTTITANGSVVIEPAADYDAMAKVTATVNVPPSITTEALSVTENGTYTAEEGKAYSPVTVNVPSGSSGGSWHTIASSSPTDTVYLPQAGFASMIRITTAENTDVKFYAACGNTSVEDDGMQPIWAIFSVTGLDYYQVSDIRDILDCTWMNLSGTNINILATEILGKYNTRKGTNYTVGTVEYYK